MSRQWQGRRQGDGDEDQDEEEESSFSSSADRGDFRKGAIGPPPTAMMGERNLELLKSPGSGESCGFTPPT